MKYKKEISKQQWDTELDGSEKKNYKWPSRCTMGEMRKA